MLECDHNCCSVPKVFLVKANLGLRWECNVPLELIVMPRYFTVLVEGTAVGGMESLDRK